MNWIRFSNTFQPRFRKKKTGLLVGLLVFVVLLFSPYPASAMGEEIKGIYGVPSMAKLHPSSYLDDMQKAGVNAVFIKPDGDTIKWFNARGFQVYVSIDAYGGRGAWKRYPDSRPVLSDGSLLGENPEYACHGGACPTHRAWREKRLGYIKKLLLEFRGKDGKIDGIWLDYIRYPARWSVLDPQIPDTCYCDRCLRKFSKDMGIQLPKRVNTEETSLWIKEYCPVEWMKWKKEQISGFVADVKKIIDESFEDSRPLLGLFLVPWTKGERQNEISYKFAQDPFQLSQLADVISPMVYHKKVGRQASWVGFMTQYYEETVSCHVWPIVQAMGCTADEFAEVIKYAGQGGADGVLGYPFSAMNAELWPGFREFRRLPNLIRRGQSAKGRAQRAERIVLGAERSRITKQPITNNPSESIGLCPGYGECAEWVMPLPACEPGAEYQFRGEFYQRVWENGAYPTVSIWGSEYFLNTHWKSKMFQPLRVYTSCPEKTGDETFRFINCNPEKTIWLRQPELKRFYRFDPVPGVPLKKAFFDAGFFPIGVYGANLKNLEQIKKLAINTVVLRGTRKKLREQVEKCHRVGLRYVLSVPHDPDRLPVYLEEISRYARPWDLAFYVIDEPGIHSFPTGRAMDVNRLIKERFPGCATCMAIVRPQVCGEYVDGADFFMLDQYPVPYMPMTWLSDCMDECAEGIGQSAEREVLGAKRIGQGASGRLASVIQAFGGKGRLDHPRLPTRQEMDCLAFLSVVHGSRGVFFYTYSWIGKTEQGRESLGRVVGRLNQVYPWLVEKNSDREVKVEMLSASRFDPKGRPAVHCCVKRKGNQWMVIAVNTIGTYVEASISNAGMLGSWEAGRRAKEVFSGEDYPLVDGRIRVRFGPYETKAFLSTDYADFR